MFGSIGFPELVFIFVVALIVFGPHKLPDVAKTFGKTLRDFRKTINDAKSTIEAEIEKADPMGDVRKEITDINNQIAAIGDDAIYKDQPPENELSAAPLRRDFDLPGDISGGEPPLATPTETPEENRENEKKESE